MGTLIRTSLANPKANRSKFASILNLPEKRVTLLGTSIDVECYGAIQTALGDGYRFQNFHTVYGGNTPEVNQSLQAASGATLADQTGPTKHGIKETQLTQTIKRGTDIALVGAPVNDAMTQRSHVIDILNDMMGIGRKLEYAGIYPVFMTPVRGLGKSIQYFRELEVGLALMCEYFEWGLVHTAPATLDAVGGLQKNSRTRDNQIHPNDLGGRIYAQEIARVLNPNMTPHHNVWLANSIQEAASVIGQDAGNLLTNGNFVTTGPTATLAGITATSTGGSVTARLPSGVLENDIVLGGIAVMTKSNTSGQLALQFDTNPSFPIADNDEIIVAGRVWGDLVGDNMTYRRRHHSITATYQSIDTVEGVEVYQTVDNSMFVTTTKKNAGSDTRLRFILSAEDYGLGTATGVLEFAQFQAINKTKALAAFKVW